MIHFFNRIAIFRKNFYQYFFLNLNLTYQLYNSMIFKKLYLKCYFDIFKTINSEFSKRNIPTQKNALNFLFIILCLISFYLSQT